MVKTKTPPDTAEKLAWKILFPLLLGNMLNPLNSTMLATALASICGAFSREASSGALLVTPLYIAATVAQPLMGKLADVYSPKRIRFIGLMIVLVAAIVGAVGTSFAWLIVSRVLLGIGTAAAFPAAMAILTHYYHGRGTRVPGRALAILTIASQTSMVVGPLLGGLLTNWLSWRGIFIVNIPLVLMAAVFHGWLPEFRKPKRHTGKSPIDYVGILLFSGMICAFFLAIYQFSWPAIIALPLLLITLVYYEHRQATPFIDVNELIQHPQMLIVYLRTTATNYVLYLLLYCLPQWVETIKHLSPAQTGWVTMPMSGLAIISSLVISRFRNVLRINVFGIVTLGSICVMFYQLNPQWSIPLITTAIALAGLAIGVNLYANQASLNEMVNTGNAGMSFGLYRTFGYFGAIVSGAQLKQLFHDGIQPDSMAHASTSAFMAFLILVVLIIIEVWLHCRRQKQRPDIA